MSKKHKKRQFNKEDQEDQKPTQPQETKQAKWENYAYHIVLIMLVLIAYTNSLNNAFVSDDVYGIMNNPFIKSWATVTAQPLKFLQPLLYYVISNTFGIIPFWFRVLNILAHIGTVSLIFIVGSVITLPIVAFFAAAIFAVHPVNIEAVAWISGGPYSWYTFFFMLSWWLYIKSEKSKTLYVLSVVSFLISLGVGIPAVVLSGVLFLYEYCFGNLKKRWMYLIPYFALSFVYGIMAVSGIGAREYSFKTEHYQDQTAYNPLLQIPVAISTYIEMFVWPAALTLYHSELNFSVAQFVVKVVIMSIYFISLLVSFFKNKTIFFGLSIFLIGLVPTLTPQSIHWVVAERYAYFSMIGLAFIVAYLLGKIPKKYEAVMYILIVVMLIGFTVRTIMRNVDWKNEDNLWFATGITSPSDPKTHNNLADVYSRRGDFKKAAEELIIAIKINPKYADAYHNLANVYQRTGQIDAAMNLYQYSLKLNPRLWQAYQNIGAIYYSKNDFVTAEKYMSKAIELNPSSTQLYSFLGIIQMRQEKKAEARQSFTKSLQIDPTNKLSQEGLGEASK